MELVINFSGGKDSTAMLALPAHRSLPVVHAPPHMGHTHQVSIWCYRTGDIGDLIGVMLHSPDEPRSARRLARIEALVRYRVHGRRITFALVPTEFMKERKALSDLERFRRKMLRAQRAYEDDRARIESGADGLFQTDRLRELDATMEKVWQKMEQRYGCRREHLHDDALRAKADALRLAGRLDETDWYEAAGS